MKRFSQQFNTAAKRVTLTKAESRNLKDRLVTYMEYHPLPKDMQRAKTVASGDVIPGEPFRVFRFNTIHIRAYVGMVALLVLIIVPFVAEQSVPGDVLYPVKVRFNEEIRSSLAITPYQQVEWETKRVERRLAEARLLATEGKLTPELESEVAAAVKSHSEAAQAGIAKLRETDSDEAAIAELSFASALEVESEVLESTVEQQQIVGASTTDAIAAVVADVRASVTTPAADSVSFTRLLARIEEETTRASELLYSLRTEMSPQERDDIDRRLADIGRKVDQAVSLHASATVMNTETDHSTSTGTSTNAVTTTGADYEAIAKQYLTEALRDIQKIIRFMTDIDVKANVSVDALVPVTPTDSEREQAITVLQNQLQAELATINRATVPNEKARFGLDRIDELASTTAAALAAKAYDSAEAALQEALALLADVRTIINQDQVETPVPATSAATTTASTSEIRDVTATTTTSTVTEPVSTDDV